MFYSALISISISICFAIDEEFALIRCKMKRDVAALTFVPCRGGTRGRLAASILNTFLSVGDISARVTSVCPTPPNQYLHPRLLGEEDYCKLLGVTGSSAHDIVFVAFLCCLVVPSPVKSSPHVQRRGKRLSLDLVPRISLSLLLTHL